MVSTSKMGLEGLHNFYDRAENYLSSEPMNLPLSVSPSKDRKFMGSHTHPRIFPGFPTPGGISRQIFRSTTMCESSIVGFKREHSFTLDFPRAFLLTMLITHSHGAAYFSRFACTKGFWRLNHSL